MTVEVVRQLTDHRERFSSSTPVIRNCRDGRTYFSFDFEIPQLSAEVNDFVNSVNYSERVPSQLSPIPFYDSRINPLNPDNNKPGIDLDGTPPSIGLVSEISRKARKCIRRSLSFKRVVVGSHYHSEEGTSPWNFGDTLNPLSLPIDCKMQARTTPQEMIQHPEKVEADYSMTDANQIMTRSQIKMLKASGRKSSLTTPTKKSSVPKSSQMKSPRKTIKFLGKSNSKVFLDGVFSKVLKKSPNGALLFGRPLEEVCSSTNEPPKVITELLSELKRTGPETFGILRKSGSVRSVKEWKENLDKGTESLNAEELNVHVVAGLLKDYFRSLPNSLLCSNLYEEWLKVPNIVDEGEKLSFTIALLGKLKKPNFHLVKSLMSVLKRIGENSDFNKMTYSNLSVCIGPSILWPSKSDRLDYSKEFTLTVSYLIEMSSELFGKDNFQNAVKNESVDKITEISSCYVPFCRNALPEQSFIRNSVKRKSDKLSDLCSSMNLPNHSSVSVESHDSGLNVEMDSDGDFEDLDNIEFGFIDGEGEDKENSHPPLKRKKQFNYSKKLYETRYPGFSQSRLRRDDRNQRRSLSRKDKKKSKSLVRAASEESIMQKLAKDEASLDFLDRQLLNETDESNLLYKKKYSITTCSKDSGFTIDDCSASASEENLLEVVKLAVALKSLDCHQADNTSCHKTETSSCLKTETPLCNQIESFDSVVLRRNSMKKIETFDDVDSKPKGTRVSSVEGIVCNNLVEYTDEQLCPLLTDDEEPCIRKESCLTSQSSFKRNSWMRKRSKTKMKFSKGVPM